MTDVQCSRCQTISTQPDPKVSDWDCACGCSYVIRRCTTCAGINQLSSLHRRGEPWTCPWCRAPNTGYSRRNDPAAAILADLAADMAHRGVSFTTRTQQQPRDTTPFLIVTTNEIPGYRITAVHGDVFGLIVRARNYFSNLGASFRTLAGGEVAGYTKLLTDSRNEARHRMWREARALGANAVIAMRFDCNEIGDIMSEVAAYGTAVTVQPLPQTEPSIPLTTAP
jgi:uncharacterized protein YbjQ (UPF0145 family)